MFIRFVQANPVAGMAARAGFLNAAYALRDDPELDQPTADRLDGLLDWFRQNLPIPARFNRTTSKGSYRRDTKGLSWFKPDAEEALGKAWEMIALLEEHGYRIDMLRSGRVGYVVYEDAQQIVAEPFADTPV